VRGSVSDKSVINVPGALVNRVQIFITAAEYKIVVVIFIDVT
jgi:hypothetical protein